MSISRASAERATSLRAGFARKRNSQWGSTRAPSVRGLGGTSGQAGPTFGIDDRFPTASLRGFRQEGEIKTINRFAALEGELCADATFFFQAGDLVAAGAAKVANPLFAVLFQSGIIHK